MRSKLFTQSRLLQALQSQLNLFTGHSRSSDQPASSSTSPLASPSVAAANAAKRGGSSNQRPSHSGGRHRSGGRGVAGARDPSSVTFLSTSLQRNSLRYASRRKYKTQSLANPYRHGQTNYPVYVHEALFMPEFSVKGQVTEADFEILDVISRGAFGHVIKVKRKTDGDDEADHGGDDSQEQQQQQQQIYAMKIMWKSQVIRDRALQQVKDEVTIAISCVDNPLIVKTWHYWQSKRFLYIITDFVENGELLSLWLKVS